MTSATGQGIVTEDTRSRLGERGVREPYTEARLATVAHELRNPLAAILYAVAAMTDQTDEPVARGQRAVVERQSRRAVRMADDLFDVCSGALGTLALRPEVVDLAEVMAVATETIKHLVTGRGQYLTVSLPPEPLFVFADRMRLERVLTNLLANAAEHTNPGGHVRLTAEADAGQVVFRVQDDGPGIAPRAFDLSLQCRGSEGRRPGGIGLALVKSVVELHGGRVTASSGGVRQGMEFVVQLPALHPEAVPDLTDVISPSPSMQPRTEQP